MRFLLILLLLSSSFLHAKKEKKKKETIVKQKIKCNMTVKYMQLPDEVDTFEEFIKGGILYGRIRINSFTFDAGSAGKAHQSIGVGGNLIYKSARLHGLAFTSGLYTSQNPWHEDLEMQPYYRYGKDTFSRHKVAKGNGFGMTALTENYISYKKNKVRLRVGRFLLESFMLKSHDTKMIPNAFEGATVELRSLPKTKIQVAYLTKQKLRDHEGFHHVLAYNDDPTDPEAKWTQNDDGAMHRGLTLQKLHAKGIDDKVMVFEVKNRTIKRTTLKANFTAVPELISSLTLEGSYTFKPARKFKIKPSIRVMKQFDNGAGAIGGANLRVDTTGYNNPNSLDSSLFATRLDFIKGAGSVRVAYSQVGDAGDIIAPWHAQPTAGYTRPMSGMNWYSNTKTVMFRADYDLGKAKIIPNCKIMSRYAINNFDDQKSGTTADTNVFTVDIIKRFNKYPNFMAKLRSIYVQEDHRVLNLNGSYKKDPSYKALRLEMNYLF